MHPKHDQVYKASTPRNNGAQAAPNGSGSHALHENTSASKQAHLQVVGPLMSQDSIMHYVEDAEKETLLERKRLALQESQRKEYAHQIISQASQAMDDEDVAAKDLNQKSFFGGGKGMKNKFGKIVDGSTQKERLLDLLEKTEQYTRFILQQNLKHHQAQQKKKLAQSILTGGSAGDGAQAGGKTSISKRKQKVHGKPEANNLSSDEENEESLLTRLTEQPSILDGGGFKLRPYQLDGLNWMISLYETGINGILADEMGLGKTVQTISLISFLREFKSINGVHLILMPKSVVGNWMAEFKRWLPQCKVLNLIAKKEQREEILKNELQPGKFDVCITTFEGVRICMSALQKFSWEYIIIDEAHKIKNEDSQTSKRIRQLKSKYRLLLTGTPLQNNLHELWSLMNFLLPEIFASSEDFDDWFDLSNKHNLELSDAEKERKNNEMIKQLHKILRPFMLRRIKRDVEKSLLPKIEMHINVGITELQKSIYRQLLKKSTIDKANSTAHYKNILIQLRKICNHPYLFQGIEPDDAPELGDHLIQTSGKMQVLDKLLKKAKAENSQSLIFSGFTSMLDILEDYCRFRGYKYCRLDGNTELDDRQAQIDDFTSPSTEKFVFLISTRAGGLGLNLMTANTVILYDSDWNPQMDLQAMDRAHRIGQKKQVRVYRLITKNTMEEKMVEKQTMKLKLDQLIIQKGRMAPKNTGLQKEDLQDMVNYGADAIFEIGSNIDDEDIEELIRKGEDKARSLNKQAEDIMREKFDMINFTMNSCNLYQFEDVDYLKEKRRDAEEVLKKNVIALMDAETNFAGRRKFQKNLAESNLCPNIFGNGNIGVSNEAKKKKLAKVQDFKFFPEPERLKDLIQLEMESRFSGYIQGLDLPVFTPEMKMEKELLESQGFSDWDRRDFQKFIQALELYACDDYVNISKHMEGTKTPQQISEYAKVFFAKIDTLADREKIKAKINKAQKNVNFNMRAPSIIRKKMLMYDNPIEEMNFLYATQKSKFFNRESDVLLIFLADKYGFGNWSKIKQAVRRDSRCRLDHLFISRSEDELKKRTIYLVQCLEKEEEENKLVKAHNANLDLEAQFEKMMLEAEQKAQESLSNLTIQSIIKFVNTTQEADHHKNKAESQDTDDFKKIMPQRSEKESSMNEIDRNMQDSEMCDYDMKEQSVERPAQKKKAKKKKGGAKKDKLIESSQSESINRLIRTEVEREIQIDEEQEEDEILRREMMNNSQSQGNDAKIESNGGNTTIDTIVDRKAMKGKSSSNRRAVEQSSKSTKQTNIADWVNTSSVKKVPPLVGTKRGATNKSPESISEFKAKQAKK